MKLCYEKNVNIEFMKWRGGSDCDQSISSMVILLADVLTCKKDKELLCFLVITHKNTHNTTQQGLTLAAIAMETESRWTDEYLLILSW